jgi:hypothetical protein
MFRNASLATRLGFAVLKALFATLAFLALCPDAFDTSDLWVFEDSSHTQTWDQHFEQGTPNGHTNYDGWK